jgi:predicted RNA-binding Zn-ribbon protein involved in translation (DUF1610 family)
MSDEIKVISGTKITPEDAAKLDRNKMTVATGQPPKTAEVEGQHVFRDVFRCPWCGHLQYAWVEEHRRHEHWFSCGHCGGNFRGWG